MTFYPKNAKLATRLKGISNKQKRRPKPKPASVESVVSWVDWKAHDEWAYAPEWSFSATFLKYPSYYWLMAEAMADME